jgi:DNA ligase-1
VNRLYAHFRAQGHEGVITKDLTGRYLLSARDPTWRKKKPEESLDLVLLGGVFAVTTKERVGLFGSYVIGARSPDGGFVDVGDIGGLDRARDAELQQEIMRDGLLTGRRNERASATGVRPGLELKPHIVVAVRYSGIVKDHATGRFSLRDPKLAFVRSDKSANDVDTTGSLEEAYIKQRIA